VRILFVDDDPSATRLYGTLLTSAGHEVVAVDSASKRSSARRAKPFDLVITDLHMPGLKGDVTLSLLRVRPSPSCRGGVTSEPADRREASA